MTEDFARPNDELYFEELKRLGKTPDCECSMDWRYGAGGARLPVLLYNLKCPVHYPQTSKLWKKVHPDD